MPPPQHTPPLPCDHCGYDLTGIAPTDAASPQMRSCPECGKRTDVGKAPRPSPIWWRFPVAVLTGSAAILAIHILLFAANRAMRGNSFQALDLCGTFLMISIPIGGAISMMISWRDFSAYQRWKAQEEGTPLHSRGPLLVEFFVYCVVDSIVAGLMGFTALVLGLF